MKDWQRVLGSTIIALVGLYWCDFTLFQSLLLALFGLAFWELRDIKFTLDKMSDKNSKENSQ